MGDLSDRLYDAVQSFEKYTKYYVSQCKRNNHCLDQDVVQNFNRINVYVFCQIFLTCHTVKKNKIQFVVFFMSSLTFIRSLHMRYNTCCWKGVVIDDRSSELYVELWSAVPSHTASEHSPVMTLATSFVCICQHFVTVTVGRWLISTAPSLRPCLSTC